MNIKQNKKFKLLSFLFFLCIYLISILFIDYNKLNNGYQITIILPLVFLLCFYGFLWEPLMQKRTPFLVLFSCVAFVRYVILSIAVIMNGYSPDISGVRPTPDSLTLAGFLMCYELIITSMLIRFWAMKKIVRTSQAANEKKELTTQANPMVYIIFILTFTFLIIFIPEAQQGLSFFTDIQKSSNVEIRSPLILGIREGFVNSKYFLLFLVIILLRRNQNNDLSKHKLINYIIILIVCIVMVGLRVGGNRKFMLVDSIAAAVILWHLFPKYKKATTFSVAVVGILLIAITTVARGLTDSLNSFFSGYFNLEFLQPYFLGQYNVAISIEALKYYPGMFDANTYLYSFLRPLFGIGDIVRNIPYVSADRLFDLRMSAGVNGFLGNHILSMIGEGYMLFGLVLAPLFAVITVRLGIFFDSLFAKSNKIEIVLVSTIASAYLAQGMILNSTIILNLISFVVAIYLPVVLIGYSLKKKPVEQIQLLKKSV